MFARVVGGYVWFSGGRGAFTGGHVIVSGGQTPFTGERVTFIKTRTVNDPQHKSKATS